MVLSLSPAITKIYIAKIRCLAAGIMGSSCCSLLLPPSYPPEILSGKTLTSPLTQMTAPHECNASLHHVLSSSQPGIYVQSKLLCKDSRHHLRLSTVSSLGDDIETMTSWGDRADRTDITHHSHRLWGGLVLIIVQERVTLQTI
jgi:hypothetical protein